MIIEDDKTIRHELKALLEKYRYTVIAVDEFCDAADLAISLRPHLILLDLSLPFLDGHQICRDIRKRSDIPIIIVTSRDNELDELMSISLGADYFVTKPYNTQILIAKISNLLNRVYAGGAASEIRFGELSLDLGRSTAAYRGQTVELTKNELRILQLLLENGGVIVSRDEIMNALWQTDTFVDDNTLTVNINRLRGKLAVIGAHGILKTRRGQGYSL
ncbi:MAG: response regulator transcription factor [Clostridiales Family XIII bacterium]|jgi:DNA-binding response OmpR family regulator|nr:response regulator transcription factor [Clostridiales Family XIII bacterium]